MTYMSHTPLRRTDLAAEIYAEIKKQRVTVKELSAASKLSPSTIYRRLGGVKSFRPDELDAIGQALGIPGSELTRRAKARA